MSTNAENGLPVGTVLDKDYIASCVRAAVGDHTLRHFARVCGTSPSTLSKLSTKDFQRPVKYSLLRSIYEHAAPGANLDWIKLLAANGMKDLAPPTTQPFSMQSIPTDYRDGERKVEQILSSTFLSAGKSISLRHEIRFPYAKLGTRRLVFDLSYQIKDQDDSSSITWNFETKLSHAGKIRNPRLFDLPLLDWLLFDAYDTTALEGMHCTLVLTDSNTFSILKNSYDAVKVRNYISLCLIDLVNEQIVDEFQFARTDGSRENLLLVFREEQQNNQLERELDSTDDQ